MPRYRALIIFASLVVLTLFCFPTTAGAAEINVPLDQPTIQAGINAAISGDTVVVADGTWNGPGNKELDFGGKNITVRSANGPAGCTIDCLGGGRAFVIHSGESRNAVIQGFTIINGGAGAGGAIDIDDSDCSIIGNVFENNDDSAINSLFGGPVIHDNIFTGNSASVGGAIYHERGHNYWFWADIRGNTFTGNSAGKGGAIYVRIANPLIIGNTFVENTVSGGAIYSSGGAVHVGMDSIPEVIDNRFTGNSADDFGGALFIEDRDGQAYVADNIFIGNQAMRGGAVTSSNRSEPRLINNLFLQNHATDIGGAVASTDWAGFTMINCTLVGNSAQTGAGAVAAEEYSDVIIRNCILYDNLAPLIGGPEIGMRESSTITISYSDVEGGEPGVFVSANSDLYWGAGMIDADPLLVSGYQGDQYLSQTAAGQAADSPCLDAGSGPASTIGYETEGVTVTLDQLTTRTDRVVDSGTVDMGYHFAATAIPTVSADLECTPPAGFLPFTANISVTMANLDDMITRRLAGKIDLQPAGGGFISGWKAGYGNVGPQSSINVSWNQNIPNLPTLVGDNIFTLRAEDVTPAPYNQPPYVPSGDTDSSACTLGGITP